MNKLKHLYPIVFVLFVGLSNTNLAQTSNKKPSLKEKLEKVFSKEKQKQTYKKENGKAKKLIAKSKPKSSPQHNKDSKTKKTLLKSRKAKSSLMDALREAMKN